MDESRFNQQAWMELHDLERRMQQDLALQEKRKQICEHLLLDATIACFYADAVQYGRAPLPTCTHKPRGLAASGRCGIGSEFPRGFSPFFLLDSSRRNEGPHGRYQRLAAQYQH
jgi:hypothetical protein